MATPVYPSMVPGPSDGLQPLLVKVCYWLEAAAEALGGTDASMPFTTMVPGAQDGVQPLLVKIAYWAEQIDGSIGGGGVGTNYQLEGHGPPVANPADLNQVWTYFDLDDGRQEYVWSVEAQSW